jgi:SP family general alpha glucoside:H+ symporter-like MFS transporter
MESYDTLLLGSLFGLPAFKQHFGNDYGGKAGYQIAPGWQAGMQQVRLATWEVNIVVKLIPQAANMGSIIGVLFGAVIVDRFGYKKSILGNLAFMTPLIGLITFAPNKGALLAGELLCGIPWGVFSTLAEAYASEVCPLSLRGYLTT